MPEMIKISCRKCKCMFVPKPWQMKKRDYTCLLCLREYNKNYRAARKLSGNPVIPGKMTPEWHREYEKKWRELPNVRHKLAAHQRRYRKDKILRPKHMARWQLNRAIIAGKITRGKCELCGSHKTDAHHDDYSRPLDVRWLCRQHHAETHANARSVK